MIAIMKKELKHYFLSPIGYIYIGIFLAACSLFFYLDVFSYAGLEFQYTFGSAVTVLTFIVPVLTMGLFAEERKTGTEQLILTSPKSITQIVMGKFLAATIVVLISVISTLVYFVIIECLGEPYLPTALIAVLGFALLSIAYIAFGMFVSTLTENQVISAVVSMGFFLLLWFLPNKIPVLSSYSLMDAFWNSFMYGTISISDTVYLLSFALMFILFTIISLQKRKLVK